MARLLVALMLVAAFCLGAAFSYYNWTAVRFHYLAGEAELPLIALMLAAFVVGLLVMWLLTLARAFGMSRESRRLQRQIRELEAELRSLRNLPLAGAVPDPAPASAPARASSVIAPAAAPPPPKNA